MSNYGNGISGFVGNWGIAKINPNNLDMATSGDTGYAYSGPYPDYYFTDGRDNGYAITQAQRAARNKRPMKYFTFKEYLFQFDWELSNWYGLK